MDYALKLNQFEELSYEEMLAVDGGDIWADLYALSSALYTWGSTFVDYGSNPVSFLIGFGMGFYELWCYCF